VAAGGSQSDHLHVHCVPRWVGDANFIAVTAETRVLPVSLTEARDRLREAWPG
jgi:ATP adenylyltransferase